MESSANTPCVSIIVPTFNGASSFLEQALESVFVQTFLDAELIVIDDGSTDDTMALIERMTARSPIPVTVLSQENSGQGVARNKGIAAARGTYLMFLDDDDWMEPNLIERAYSHMKQLDADIVVWDLWFYSQSQNMRRFPFFGTLDFGNFSDGSQAFDFHENPERIFTSFQNWPWNKMFRTEFVRQQQLEFSALRRSEDIHFTCNALVAAERIGVIYDRLVNYRVQRAGSSMDSLDISPCDIVEAFVMLKESLVQRGVYDEVRPSYVNWAVGSIFANLDMMRTVQGFEALFSRLHTSGLTEMDLDDDAMNLVANSVDIEYLDLIRCAESVNYLHARSSFFRLMWDNERYFMGTESDKSHKLEMERDDLLDRCKLLDEQLENVRQRLAVCEDAQERLAVCEADLQRRNREFDEVMGAAEQRIGRAICLFPRWVQRKMHGE